MTAVIKCIRFFIVVLVVLGLGVAFSALSTVHAAPAVPNLQSATAISSCAAQLSWDQSSEADSFQFNVNGSSFTGMPADRVKPQVSGTGAKTFIHSELSPGASYAYRVKACLSVGGCSDASSPGTASTPALVPPPAPPTNIMVNEWQADGGRVVLKWTPAAGNPQTSGFRVYRSDDNGANFSAVGTFTLQQFTDAGSVWMDAVSTDGERRYEIKTYQTDQYCTVVDNSTPESSAWVSFSAFSRIVTVPARPATVGVKESIEGGTKAIFEWSAVPNVTSYNLQVSQYEDFRDIVSSGYNFSYGAGTTETPDYVTLAPNKLFYYRVRAMNSNGQGEIGISDFRGSTFSSTLTPPKNFSVMVMSVSSSGKAVLRFSWTDEATFEPRRIRIYDKLLPGGTPSQLVELGSISCVGTPQVCTYPTTYSTEATLGTMHEYSVTFLSVSDGRESDSATFELSLNVAQLLGWAWSGINDILGNGPFGLGWIRLSNNTISTDADATVVAKSAEANPYSVFVADDGTLSGYAWNPVGGWLSFNERNGCPSGGDCTPRVDWATGRVSGWAKFLVPAGGFDGWVSLRSQSGEAGYGLCIGALASGDETGATCAGGSSFASVLSGSASLNGYAWGGSQVVGWINFSSAVVAPNAPQLLEVVPISATEVQVRWNNPVEYQRVKIQRSPANHPEADPLTQYEIVPNINPSPSAGEHTETIQGLSASTTYGFFIRGYTK